MRENSAILPVLIGFLIIDRFLSAELEMEVAAVSIAQHSADQYSMQKCDINAVSLSVKAGQSEPRAGLPELPLEPHIGKNCKKKETKHSS